MLPINPENFPAAAPAPGSGSKVLDWSGKPQKPHEARNRDWERKSLPKITVITPSYHQAEFIEETIRSILLQQYPELEYIVIDGGSSDGSIEIIKKYEQWIDYWISEPDNGQTHAINKGLQQATGDYVIYLNSDDIFFPGALHKVAMKALEHPEAPWLAGYTQVFGHGNGESYNVKKPDRDEIDKPEHWITYKVHVPQHSSFVKREVYDELGYYDESLNFVFDLEFGLRLGLHGLKPIIIDEVLAGFRIHEKSKTESSRLPFLREQKRLLGKYEAEISERAIREAGGYLDEQIAAHMVFDSLNTTQPDFYKTVNAAYKAFALDRSILKKRYFWGALKRSIWQ